jgi:metallo-beta-lactamase class B
MIPMHRTSALWVLLAASASAGAQQAPRLPPADPPSVTAIVNRARAAAATEWRETADFFCGRDSARANRADDPEITPTRVFDNLYAIGRTGTVVWAIMTRDGIVLIDAGYPDQVDTVLLPGLRKLGLDPNDVKYVLVGHGHADHFGGASYFQQRGARVVLSAADWALVENAPPPAGGNAAAAAPPPTGAPPTGGGAPAAPALPPPKRDLVAEEGRPIEFGGAKIAPVLIPGHTPGSLGFVFDVDDRGQRHTAALFGGSILLVGRIPTDGLEQYVRSVEHFANVTRSLGVDVEIQNHPLYDGFVGKLERLGARAAADQHPFVIGSDAYQRFLTVMAECTRAEIERRRVASGSR